MPNLTQFDLHTSGSTIFLIILLLAAVAFSYFVYRKTVPPVPKAVRYLLMSIRALAVILVILLLFEPILSITRKKQEKPVLAVLVDNSASMGLEDQKVNRPKAVQQVLSSDLFKKPVDNLDMEFYQFSYQLSERLDTVPDSIEFVGDGTDIQRVLTELKEKMAEKYFAGVILITDGADNLGENPARYASTYGVPIHPIAIGDPQEQKDVLISNYVTNEIVYSDVKVPVDVFVRSSGFKETRIPVNLTYQNKTIDSKIVTLSGSGLEQKVRLQFIPREAGFYKYEIKLPQLEGELTHLNNVKSFYVKVIKSKLKVLIFAGGPSADFVFLKRALEADKNLNIQTLVEKGRGVFYQGTTASPLDNLAEFDCLILLDFPRRSSNRQTLTQIKSILAQGKPVLFVFGKNVDFEKLWTLKEFTPLAAKPSLGRERLVYLRILPQGIYHPIFQISEDEFENREKWQELPPIFSNYERVVLHPKAQTLAVVDILRSDVVRKQRTPLMAMLQSGTRKSMAIFGYGLWRWDLLMWGVNKSNESYQRFLQNTVRWLVTREDSKLVRITSNKEIYRSGEQVKFTAQVYTKDYLPVDGAEVVVNLQGADEAQQLSLSNMGEGRYEGSFQVLEGGDYQFEGTAHLQGRVLGRDRGKFTVEEFKLEYQDTRMNEDLLKRIAAESGGEFYTLENFSNLKEKLEFPEKYIVLSNEWEVWNKPFLLIVGVFLLGLEWFIRKRKGML
jgi:hypothetical protein